MSLAEIIYRVRQLITSKAEKIGVLGIDGPIADKPDRDSHGFVPHSGIKVFDYAAEADRILEGTVPIFATKQFFVGELPQWNTDPLTQISAPLSFGPELPITDQHRVGNIKYVWELNRHLHLVRIAQAYAVSKDDRYLNGLRSQLSSWLDQCPPLKGPNWSSSLELALRLISWSLIWRFVGGWDSRLFHDDGGRPFRGRWLSSIYSHCNYIFRHRSRYSSANNHLIGELVGLYVAANTWPCWRESARWAHVSRNELEREARSQYFQDGANREQATAYHIFSTEFLLLAGIIGQGVDDPFSHEYWGVLRRAYGFLRAIRNVDGNLPMFGDADDGIVWRLACSGHEDRAGMLLSLMDVVMHGMDIRSSESAMWLLEDCPRPITSGKAVTESEWHFPEAGYHFFGRDFNTPKEIKGSVDSGPLGFLGIAAHGHADALSITLSVGGEPCLVDPGTYSYWNELEWRDYFRGTSAHNTVRVDGLDQSVSGGRFMWTRKAACQLDICPSSPGDFSFRASHDGYLRLDDPVIHQRDIRFDASSNRLIVIDTVNGVKSHYMEQFWHFAPGVDVSVEGTTKKAIARGRRFEMLIELDGDSIEVDKFHGSTKPILGWYSANYDVKTPCTTLRVSSNRTPITMTATFSIR